MTSSILRTLMCLALLGLSALPAAAEEVCLNASDMDAGTKAELEKTATHFLQMAIAGDYAGLKQNAIPGLASNFVGVENAIYDNKRNLQGADITLRSEFQLDASGNTPIPRAQFYCGVFNSLDSVAFQFSNLPPGRYALVMEDVHGGKAPITVSQVLQQFSGGWKMAGFYVRLLEIGGHDGDWYLNKARDYKIRGQGHNAWFYYLTAWDLLNPVDFMSTPRLEKIADEMQPVRPGDLPGNGNAMDFPVNGKTYRVTQIFPSGADDGDTLDVVVKYQVPSIADRSQIFQDNMALIKAIVSKYPELREAFAGVVARAGTPNGDDYGSLLAMKDVK